MSRSSVLTVSLVICSVAFGCGQIIGPLVRPIVRAREPRTGKQATTLRIADSTTLILMVYSAQDSMVDPGVSWFTRNAGREQ